jgi:hypothetical protein
MSFDIEKYNKYAIKQWEMCKTKPKKDEDGNDLPTKEMIRVHIVPMEFWHREPKKTSTGWKQWLWEQTLFIVLNDSGTPLYKGPLDDITAEMGFKDSHELLTKSIESEEPISFWMKRVKKDGWWVFHNVSKDKPKEQEEFDQGLKEAVVNVEDDDDDLPF